VIEGSAAEKPADDAAWQEYEFPGKPGSLRRHPPQVAPYHLRLDWLMWFAALRSGYAEDWFAPLLVKLLEGDRAVLRLLRHNPFPDRPPVWVRARYYRYRFSSRAERRDTGVWWVREPVGEYVRPVRLSRAGAARA
jgi:lipase maturation factor